MPNIVKVTDGIFNISWTVEVKSAEVTTVTQVDRLGTYPLDFRTEHNAVAWMLDQAHYAVNEMGFKYTIS